MAAMWRCPYCWKEQLDYEDLSLENESFCYPRTCWNCGAEWLERYTFEYDDQELITEWDLSKKAKENEED